MKIKIEKGNAATANFSFFSFSDPHTGKCKMQFLKLAKDAIAIIEYGSYLSACNGQ